MEYKIEKEVPLPNNMRKSGIMKVLAKMEVGDSVFAARMHPFAGNTMNYFREKGMRFSQHKVEGGYRVWRVE